MDIFLAAPFTYKIDTSTQLIECSYRSWLETIIKCLESIGHHVTAAHIREDWGAKVEPPEIAIQNDSNSISDCDLIIAYPGNPPSTGVTLELGFAAVFKKPIIIIHENTSPVPYLVKGIHILTKTYEISFDDDKQIQERLKETVAVINFLRPHYNDSR